MAFIDFGDRVQVVQAPSTVASGDAGQQGTCYGWTTPSVTGVDVVGGGTEDFAWGVRLDEDDVDTWFATGLLEVVSHDEDLRITIGDKAFTRAPDGSWTPSA